MSLPAATPEMVAERIRRYDANQDLWTGQPLSLEELAEKQTEEQTSAMRANAASSRFEIDEE